MMSDPIDPRARSAEGALKEQSVLETIGLIAGVLGLTALIFGIVLFVIDPKVGPLTAMNVATGVVAISFYAITNRRTLMRAIGGRSTALVLLEVVSVLGVLGALVAINVFAAKNTTEWDFTRDSLYTLTEQSIKVARGLKAPVKIVGFYRSTETARARLLELVELYKRESDQISLETYNPDSTPPAIAKQYQMSANSPRIVVVAASGQMTKIKQPSEELLTNAIVKVAERTPRKVYFIKGHGGPNIADDKTEGGYKRAANDLRDEGYEVAELSLIDQDIIPKDSTVIVVPPVTSALLPNEVAALKTWLIGGGRVLALLEPAQSSGLAPIFDEFSIEVGDDLVVDPNPASKALGFGPDAPIIQKFEAHPITDPLEESAALFYSVRSVSPKLGARETRLTTLIRTGDQSWGERNYSGAAEAARDENDLPGPVPIAIAGVRAAMSAGDLTSHEARLVVFGDGHFADNRFGPVSGNGDLFLNAVNWLAGEEDRIAIRPKTRGSSRLPLTESQQYGIMFFSVNLLPLLIIGFGFSVWAVRRRK